MDILALRVAAIYMVRLALSEGEEEPSGKGGVPPRWQEWLDAVHHGGKNRVPNPNTDTRSRYPDVSYSTALKDKEVFRKAIKEYREWVGKNPEKETSKEAPNPRENESGAESKPKDEPKSEASQPEPEAFKAFGVTDKEVEAYSKKHAELFDSLISKGKSALKNFDYATSNKGDGLKNDYDENGEVKQKSAFAQREWDGLSEAEKVIHVIGHELGEEFEKSLTTEDDNNHYLFFSEWRRSSGSPGAHKMMGALSTLGIKGERGPGDNDPKNQEARDAGKDDKKLREYAKKAYIWQQAIFKRLGVKELTLYRGVEQQGVGTEPPDDGAEVQIKTRELSSFTTDPDVAGNFGRPIKFKVPVSHVFGSNLVRPSIGSDVNAPPSWGEAELVVMGATDLNGELADRAGLPSREKELKKKTKAPAKEKKKTPTPAKEPETYKGKLHQEINWKDLREMEKLPEKERQAKYDALAEDFAKNNSLKDLDDARDEIRAQLKEVKTNPNFDEDNSPTVYLESFLYEALARRQMMDDDAEAEAENKKTASGKPIEIHFDEENEDWLQNRRKALKSRKKTEPEPDEKSSPTKGPPKRKEPDPPVKKAAWSSFYAPAGVMDTLAQRIAARFAYHDVESSEDDQDLARDVTAFGFTMEREHYLPPEARSEKPLVPEGTDLEIYTWDGAGPRGDKRFYGIAFAGKSQKPLWHLAFRTQGNRIHEIRKTIEDRKQRIQRKQDELQAKRDFVHGIKVGDIFYASWGYDQTNVDFYQIIEVKGKVVILREIGKKVVDEDSHGSSERVVAEPDHFVGPPILKRPTGTTGAPSIKVTSSSWAHPWDGKSLHQTGPYAGH